MAESLSPSDVERYSRHLLLPEVGVRGQGRLQNASVLVIGMGGLGAPVSLYLAAAGVGRLTVLDRDALELSNLQRQVLYTTQDVGRRKVEAARSRLVALNPMINIETLDVDAAQDGLDGLLDGIDLVIDGTDNFHTRYAINDACVRRGLPFVYASISQFEGQVSLFSTPDGPCYRCLFPERPPSHLVPSCAEGGVLGVLPGLMGTLQATEALKYILGIGESLAGRLLLVDALSTTFREVRIPKDPSCIACGTRTTLSRQPSGAERKTPRVSFITPDELHRRLKAGSDLKLLDVRTDQERKTDSLGGEHIPLASLPESLDQIEQSIDGSSSLVIYCQHGGRSAQALSLLETAGFEKVYSLHGGLSAWRQQYGDEEAFPS